MATPDMVSFMMENLKDAMEFVLECTPNDRREVLQCFTSAMDSDILVTVIKFRPQSCVIA